MLLLVTNTFRWKHICSRAGGRGRGCRAGLKGVQPGRSQRAHTWFNALLSLSGNSTPRRALFTRCAHGLHISTLYWAPQRTRPVSVGGGGPGMGHWCPLPWPAECWPLPSLSFSNGTGEDVLERGAASVGADRPHLGTGTHRVNLPLQIPNPGAQTPLLPHFTATNTDPGRGGVSPKPNCWRFYILGFSTAANEVVVGVGIKADAEIAGGRGPVWLTPHGGHLSAGEGCPAPAWGTLGRPTAGLAKPLPPMPSTSEATW